MSPTEQIIVQIEKPIVLSEVRGVLRSAGGGWPEGVEVVFEIRERPEAGRVRSALADRKGNFHLNFVPSGTYIFKATANGWQSLVGTVVVSKGATTRQIELVMPLGV